MSRYVTKAAELETKHRLFENHDSVRAAPMKRHVRACVRWCVLSRPVPSRQPWPTPACLRHASCRLVYLTFENRWCFIRFGYLSWFFLRWIPRRQHRFVSAQTRNARTVFESKAKRDRKYEQVNTRTRDFTVTGATERLFSAHNAIPRPSLWPFPQLLQIKLRLAFWCKFHFFHWVRTGENLMHT